MLRHLVPSLALILFVACSSSSTPADEATTPESMAAEPAPAPEASEANAASPRVETCTAECVQSRQMEAVGAELIERECKETCAQDCRTQCLELRSGQGLQPDLVASECERECGLTP